MKNITSYSFFEQWTSVVTERKNEMLSVWRNNSDLTYFVKGSDNSIINQISKNLGLLAYEQDYYSIDAILYNPEDLTPNIKENTYWFRDIKIAFEHENNFKSGLYQEISHLLITNCELKVLVSYPDYEPDDELEYLHHIIKGTRHCNEISRNENLLLIFGYENGFEWEGYVFKEKGWRKLLPKNLHTTTVHRQ